MEICPWMILTLGPSVGSTVAWTWVMMDQMVMMMMMMVEGDPPHLTPFRYLH